MQAESFFSPLARNGNHRVRRAEGSSFPSAPHVSERRPPVKAGGPREERAGPEPRPRARRGAALTRAQADMAGGRGATRRREESFWTDRAQIQRGDNTGEAKGEAAPWARAPTRRAARREVPTGEPERRRKGRARPRRREGHDGPKRRASRSQVEGRDARVLAARERIIA